MLLSRRSALGGAAAALAFGAAAAREPQARVLTDAMEGTATPGAAALVIRDCRAERELVAGVRKLGAPALVARGDRWHLGSNGKAMTATLVARLAERGALAWDRPLAQMLPQFAQTMHSSYRDVTLPDLMAHRAGLPRDLSEAQVDFFNAFHHDRAPLAAQRLSYLDQALRQEPAAEKRAEPAYSNTGFVVAAACAERRPDASSKR